MSERDIPMPDEVLAANQQRDAIRSRECPDCHVCGSPGKPLYADLQDRLYSAPGKWRLSECTNKEYGMLWLNPMPIEEDIIRAYQEYYTHTTTTQKSWVRHSLKPYLGRGYTAARYGYDILGVTRFQKLLASLGLFFWAGHLPFDYDVMHLSAQHRGKLLEVGFGRGTALRNMAALGWDAYGVDFDPIAVENALKDGLNVRQGSLQEQDYPDKFFDAVTMAHVIEHVHNPRTTFEECYRILKPGGVFVSITPNVHSIGHRLFKSDWFPLEPPRHLYLFTPSALKRLALKAGFSEAKIKTSRRGVYVTYLWSMSIRRTGRANMYVHSNPLQERLFALCANAIELLHSKVATQYGGEMILIAKK